MCTRTHTNVHTQESRKVEGGLSGKGQGSVGTGREHAIGDGYDQNISMNENAMMKPIVHNYYTLLKDILKKKSGGWSYPRVAAGSSLQKSEFSAL